MSMRAERTPHGRSSRAGQAEPPKKKPNLKKLWPQIKALVMPRKGLLVVGLLLMLINRVAGLVLPYTSKPLVDKVMNPVHPHPEMLEAEKQLFLVPAKRPAAAVDQRDADAGTIGKFAAHALIGSWV